MCLVDSTEPLHGHRVGRTTSPACTQSQSGSASVQGQVRVQGPGKVPIELHHLLTKWEKTAFTLWLKVVKG